MQEVRGSSPLISIKATSEKKSLFFFYDLPVNEEKYGARKMCREVPVGSSAFEGDLNRSSYAAEAGRKPKSPHLHN